MYQELREETRVGIVNRGRGKSSFITSAFIRQRKDGEPLSGERQMYLRRESAREPASTSRVSDQRTEDALPYIRGSSS